MKAISYVLFTVVITLNLFSTAKACKGCISLDEYNFEKVIPQFPAVLVKFDIAFPYGEKHEVFIKLAEEVVSNKDLVVGQVGVKDYGDKENEALAKKFGVDTKEDLPLVLLFIGSTKKYVTLDKDADFTLESLRNLIRDNTDIYIGLPGCLEAFDKLAAKFITASDKEEYVKKADELSGKVDEEGKSVAKIYIQVMKKVVEQGVSFISNEKTRLKKILKDGKINEKKKQELSYRLNILHSFSIRDEL